MSHSQARAHPGLSDGRHLKMQEALQLRSAGKTYEVIARIMGIGVTTARELVRDAVAKVNAENMILAEDLRQQITGRLEFALNAISAKVEAGDVYAIEKWVMINRELAKLYGVHTPVESKAELTINHNVLPAGPGSVGERIAGIIAKHQERQLEAPGNQVPITVDVVSVRELDPQ